MSSFQCARRPLSQAEKSSFVETKALIHKVQMDAVLPADAVAP